MSKLNSGFAEWLAITKNESPASITKHCSCLKQLNVWFALHPFTAPSARQFLYECKQTHSPGTVRNYLKTLRIYLDYLKITPNWAREIPLEKPSYSIPDILSIEEIQSLIVWSHPPTMYDYIFNILAITGCRITEVTSLRIKDIDFSNSTFNLIKTKTGKPRTVILSKELAQRLYDYSKEKQPNEYIFSTN